MCHAHRQVTKSDLTHLHLKIVNQDLIEACYLLNHVHLHQYHPNMVQGIQRPQIKLHRIVVLVDCQVIQMVGSRIVICIK